MIVYFYWNGLILNIRFYFQYLFLIHPRSHEYQNNAIVFRVWSVPVLGVKMLAHAQSP